MEPHPSPSRSLPLHVVVTVLQFAVPEIMSPGEARVLCRGAASALASPSFWRGMTVTLNRDEGSEERAVIGAGVGSTKRLSAAEAATKPRSNADCLGSSGAGVGARDGIGVGAGKRSRANAGGNATSGTFAGGAGQAALGAASARQFLRRYHHHVAFRRLSPPITYTETVEMPVPLYPTCLDVCGHMVAVGTRKGPVLLFDVGPRSSAADPSSPQEGLMPRAVATAATATTPASSSKFGGSTSGDNSNRNIRHGGGLAHAASTAGAAASIGTGSSCAGGGADGESTTSCGSVTRVYGSLADGTGPISSVILDRAKVIAAGRGSRRNGGGFVIRIYAVDSTRLLRTLRCVSEVSRMCLFDPVLAVLSSGSGRLSFRDLYADGGSGLGQRTTAGVSAVAFAAVERQSNGRGSGSGSGSGANSTNPDDQGGNNDHDNHVVLHCVDRSGTMSEASTFGVVWNVERDSSGPADVSAEAAAEWRVWHVCADMEASLLVRATPWGNISGWRLHPSGRRARGSIFSFRLGFSSASASPTARRLTSVFLAAGGLILATASEGTGPKLWDLRLARRSHKWTLASEAAFAAEARAGGASGGAREGTQAAASNGARGEDANDGGRVKGRARGRCMEVRPWPAGAWAVGVAVDAGSGRLVSACSDGRLRITKLRSNNEEARLRAAVLLARKAKHTVARRKEVP